MNCSYCTLNTCAVATDLEKIPDASFKHSRWFVLSSFWDVESYSSCTFLVCATQTASVCCPSLTAAFLLHRFGSLISLFSCLPNPILNRIPIPRGFLYGTTTVFLNVAVSTGQLSPQRPLPHALQPPVSPHPLPSPADAASVSFSCTSSVFFRSRYCCARVHVEGGAEEERGERRKYEATVYTEESADAALWSLLARGLTW